MKEIAIWGIPSEKKSVTVLIANAVKWYEENYYKQVNNLEEITPILFKVRENREVTCPEKRLDKRPRIAFYQCYKPRSCPRRAGGRCRRGSKYNFLLTQKSA
jgi:hypothetical protein